MFSCEPDDKRIEDIDPLKKLWMFYNWIADQTDDAELAKNHAYLLGSFVNPEAVRKLVGEGSTVHKTTDEEFEKSTEMVARARKINSEKPKKKRKKKLK